MNTLCTNTDQTNLTAGAICTEQSESTRYTSRESYLSQITHMIWVAGKTLTRYVMRKYNQRLDRQAFNYLLTLDENLLNDIGVTKQDILWASQLPLEVDAAAKIEEIARRR